MVTLGRGGAAENRAVSCGFCRGPLTKKGRGGIPQQYCSSRCRTAAWRARAADAGAADQDFAPVPPRGPEHPAYGEGWWHNVALPALLLLEAAAAADGAWVPFREPETQGAAAFDWCIRCIVHHERPAESVRVEWRRRDGSWAGQFPRLGAEDDAELAGLDRWPYHGRLLLGPKRPRRAAGANANQAGTRRS